MINRIRDIRKAKNLTLADVAATGRTPRHLPASPLMHGTGFMSSLQALCSGGAIVTLESRSFDPHELWRAVEAQHRVATLRLVDDQAEQAVLEQLLEASKPPLPPHADRLHFLLSTPFRYLPPWPSRFRWAAAMSG